MKLNASPLSALQQVSSLLFRVIGYSALNERDVPQLQ
jgi:hypothetical protein